MKRSKIEFPLQFLAANKHIISDLSPIDACKIAFIANHEHNKKSLDAVPEHILNFDMHDSIVKQPNVISIDRRSFDLKHNKTLFYLSYYGSVEPLEISAEELVQKYELLYGLGSANAAMVGSCASEDILQGTCDITTLNSEQERAIVMNANNQPAQAGLKYYHILCVSYIAILISGIGIVSRLFPFHIPFTNTIIPLCAGMIFYPLTFFIQDVTTEVYGYARSRQMVWLAIFTIIFYVFYTQLATHLPTGNGFAYANNSSFNIVFNRMPRQLLSLIISLLCGTLINDMILSKTKIIFAGQYLWARAVCSTMIGEAVLQIIGNIVGFTGLMNTNTDVWVNMIFSYSYKLIWNISLVPFLYLISRYLKKKEGIDVYDYDVNYNPFVFGVSDGSSPVINKEI